MIDLLAALSLMTQPALAPTSSACATMDTALPAGLAVWANPGATLASGAAARVTAGTSVPNLAAATRPGPSAAISFTITQAGTYAVALDQGAWIDVFPLGSAAQPGAALHSVAHGHGPVCSTIRKIVRFELAPGSYALQLSGLQRPEARVMLVPAAAAAGVPTEGARP